MAAGAIDAYRRQIEKELQAGNATEETHRPGRTLTYDDLEHHRKVVTALSETIRLMAEIDVAIPGWPIE